MDAIENALSYDSKVLVEEFIDAREIECGIIGNENPRVALLGEVITDSEFYDYRTKIYFRFGGCYYPRSA